MLLVGLWHGAGLHYVVWGGLHGLFLSFERVAIFGDRAIRKRPRIKTVGGLVKAVFAAIVVFNLVSLAWVFFRSDSVGAAAALLGRLFTAGGWGIRPRPLLFHAMPRSALRRSALRWQ